MRRAAEWRLLERTGALFAQLCFIAAGVYLGNRADAWREERSHREAARAALQNFRTEIVHNRDLVAGRAVYHRGLLDSLGAVRRTLSAEGTPMRLEALFARIGFQGTQSVAFRHTAWDLSLATQSLSYLDPRLAFSLASVYETQTSFQRYQDSFLSNMLTPVSFNDAHTVPIARTMGAFMYDVVSMEKELTTAYGRLLPRIDSALAKLPR